MNSLRKLYFVCFGAISISCSGCKTTSEHNSNSLITSKTSQVATSNATSQQQHTLIDIAQVQVPEAGQKSEHFKGLQTFLLHFGYYKSSYKPGTFDESTKSALKEYQKFNKIPQSGTLDSNTRNRIAVFRCALPDRSAAAATPLCPWPKAKGIITYAYEDPSPDCPVDYSKYEIQVDQAFVTWQNSVPGHVLTFQKVTNSTKHDILIGWRTNTDSDYPDMNTNGLLAHSDFPIACRTIVADTLPIHFKIGPRWGIDGVSGDFDLQSVALHEIGHVLGLAHSSDPNAIMRPYFIQGGSPRRSLQSDDLQGLAVLYGG